MSRESVVFGVAGVLFGLLAGWIIGSQQGSAGSAPVRAPAQQSSAAPAQTAPPLDEARAATLTTAADRNPADAETRVQLGDLYFDAERYEDAVRWYQAALKIDPKHVNASTDLGIAYYYSNKPDLAIEQFERSLAIDPRHSKTLLNLGIVKAFGKEDLAGAAKAWEQVLELAPASPEARAARQALEGIKSGHAGGTIPPAKAPGQPD